MLFLKPYNCLSKFLGALLTFSHFLLQGKILCFARVGKSLARCIISEAFRRPRAKNNLTTSCDCNFYNSVALLNVQMRPKPFKCTVAIIIPINRDLLIVIVLTHVH